VEKQLFASGENEVGTAVDAFENFIREFHGRLPRRRERPEIGH